MTTDELVARAVKELERSGTPTPVPLTAAVRAVGYAILALVETHKTDRWRRK